MEKKTERDRGEKLKLGNGDELNEDVNEMPEQKVILVWQLGPLEKTKRKMTPA